MSENGGPQWGNISQVIDGGGILHTLETLQLEIHQLIEAWWRMYASFGLITIGLGS